MLKKYLVCIIIFVALNGMEQATLDTGSTQTLKKDAAIRSICMETDNPFAALARIEALVPDAFSREIDNIDDVSRIDEFASHVNQIIYKISELIHHHSSCSLHEIQMLLNTKIFAHLSSTIKEFICAIYDGRYVWQGRWTRHVPLTASHYEQNIFSKDETKNFVTLGKEPFRVVLKPFSKALELDYKDMEEACAQLSHTKDRIAILLFSYPTYKGTLLIRDSKHLHFRIQVYLLNMNSESIPKPFINITRVARGYIRPEMLTKPDGPESSANANMYPLPRLLFSPNDKLLFIGLGYGCLLADLAGDSVVQHSLSPFHKIRYGSAACFSQDSSIFAMLCQEPSRAGSQTYILIIDTRTGDTIKEVPFPLYTIEHICFALNDRMLIAFNRQTELWYRRHYNKVTSTYLAQCIESKIRCAKLHPTLRHASQWESILLIPLLRLMLGKAKSEALQMSMRERILARAQINKSLKKSENECSTDTVLPYNQNSTSAANNTLLLGHSDDHSGAAPTYLAIDGEGTQAYLSLAILEQIEFETEVPIIELFDIISGSSFGAVAALGLAASVNGTTSSFKLTEVLESFADNLGSIFNKNNAFNNKRYNTLTLQNYLRKLFNHTKLSDTRKRIILPLSKFNCAAEPMLFRCDTKTAQQNETADYNLATLGAFATADQKYFPAIQESGTRNHHANISTSAFYLNNSAALFDDDFIPILNSSPDTAMVLSITPIQFSEMSLRTHSRLRSKLDYNYLCLKPTSDSPVSAPDEMSLEIIERYHTEAEKICKNWEAFLRKLAQYKDQKNKLEFACD